MGKKKNNFEASGSGTKKEERSNRVPLPVSVGRLMHMNWTPYRRVPVPPVPMREPDRSAEIRRRRRYLPPDLHSDPAYAIESDSWRTWLLSERGRRRRAGFMGDMDFPFDRPPAPHRRAQQAPTPAQYEDDDDDVDDDDKYIEALTYHNEEVKDDSDDYVACIFQEWQLAMVEGRKFEYPDNMTDGEAARLGVLVSENDQPVQPPLPRYATGIMPLGLSEDKALRLALQDSTTPQPPPPHPPYNPWGPPHQPWALQPPPQPWAPPPQPWAPPPPPQLQDWAPPPPAPPARPTYVPPVPNWPWVVPELVVLDSDEEK
nr:actin cytoskeleton-regulatory complex protein pan-1-like [Lolium perenne]